jgi:rod shape-determining protein MreC
MESFFVRYRNLIVLLAVLVAQIVGLAMQVRRTGGGHNSLNATDGSGVQLIRYWAESLVAPPQRFFHGSKLGIKNLWSGYIDLRDVRQQNHELQQTIDRLRLEQAELLEDAHQGQRLQGLLGFEEHYIYSTVPAQAYGSSGSEESRLFYIDKGAADGLKRDMPVISPDGVVGKVRDVFPHSAQILAINDQTSGAGVILETTRIRGVLKGDAAGRLEIVDLMADQRIKPGEKVLTAGGDLVFPRGLPVGTVNKVIPDPDRDSFIRVIVTPSAHLERLDEVLVITSTQPRFPAKQLKDMTASEQLKGAEAAAIEEQMKASQIMAERLPGLTDPNAPPSTQPTAAPNGQNGAAGQNGTAQAQTPAGPPAPKLLPTLHPDRFSPGVADGDPASATPASTPDALPKPAHAPAAAIRPAGETAAPTPRHAVTAPRSSSQPAKQMSGRPASKVSSPSATHSPAGPSSGSQPSPPGRNQ